MNSETTSDAFPKIIPHEMLQHIADKVGEPKPFEISPASAGATATSVASELSPTENTYTRIICNVLTAFWRIENTRLPTKKPSIKYQIIGNRHDRIITLVINYVKILELADCRAIMRGETRLIDMRFQFTSLLDSKALKYGCVSIDISCTTPVGASVPYVALPARYRRARTMQIDWSKSVVLKNDRQIVLDLIDDVFNMQEFMPTDITHWLEGLYQQTATVAASNGKRHGDDNDYARGIAANDDDDNGNESDDTATTTNGDEENCRQQQQQIVGYCLSFTNLPSFNLSFLADLKEKYSTRWLTALILFPTNRAPQRLAISISCETTLMQSNTIAANGSKRIKKIIDSQLLVD